MKNTKIKKIVLPKFSSKDDRIWTENDWKSLISWLVDSNFFSFQELASLVL